MNNQCTTSPRPRCYVVQCPLQWFRGLQWVWLKCLFPTLVDTATKFYICVGLASFPGPSLVLRYWCLVMWSWDWGRQRCLGWKSRRGSCMGGNGWWLRKQKPVHQSGSLISLVCFDNKANWTLRNIGVTQLVVRVSNAHMYIHTYIHTYIRTYIERIRAYFLCCCTWQYLLETQPLLARVSLQLILWHHAGMDCDHYYQRNFGWSLWKNASLVTLVWIESQFVTLLGSFISDTGCCLFK